MKRYCFLKHDIKYVVILDVEVTILYVAIFTGTFVFVAIILNT